MCIIGKGPLKEQFIEQVKRECDQYQHVEFCFPWLDADDYPLLLGKVFWNDKKR
jgi:beta-1,4-mannosyltransferase